MNSFFTARRRAAAAAHQMYVQDGLLFWFDGIWNGGEGQHTTDTTKLVNLITGNYIQEVNAKIGSNCLYNEAVNEICYIRSGTLPSASHFITCEICFVATQNRTQNLGSFISKLNAGGNYYECYPWQPGQNPSTWHLHYLGTNTTLTSTFNCNGATRTYSMPAGDGRIRLFENGTQIGVVNRTGTFDLTGDYHFSLGAFKGEIYSCRIYDRILQEAEIRQNYMVDRDRFNF